MWLSGSDYVRFKARFYIVVLVPHSDPAAPKVGINLFEGVNILIMFHLDFRFDRMFTHVNIVSRLSANIFLASVEMAFNQAFQMFTLPVKCLHL